MIQPNKTAIPINKTKHRIPYRILGFSACLPITANTTEARKANSTIAGK